MAKKAGTATKSGGIKSWMNHLFAKSNKQKTNNVGVTTKARSTIDSLSEKNTTGSGSAMVSIGRSSSSTTTTTTATTQSSSNHHHSKVPETAHPPTATGHDLAPSNTNLAVPSVDHNKEGGKDEHVDTQEDQQPSDDCPAPIEVNFFPPSFPLYLNSDTRPILQIFWQHGGHDVFVAGSFDNWSGKYCKSVGSGILKTMMMLFTEPVRMEKQVDGVFVARLRTSDHTVWYKFVVDGYWKHDDTKPTEMDKGKRAESMSSR
jgi:hypothetical protein